jgi:hypothetical protein
MALTSPGQDAKRMRGLMHSAAGRVQHNLKMADLLAAKGFRLRSRGRADCVHCSGTSRGTVAFTSDVAFCHRCRWSANINRMAREQGITILARKTGRASIRKDSFRHWLSQTYTVMADEERRLARRAELAKAALNNFPDNESAWSALADWYHRQHSFEMFFSAAQDRIGRFDLYKSWRCANA